MSGGFLAAGSPWWSDLGTILTIYWTPVVTIGGLVVWAARRARSAVDKTIERFIQDDLKPILGRLAGIEEELQPNGGSTMRDAVNSTREGVRRVAIKVDVLTERVEGLADRVENLENRPGS